MLPHVLATSSQKMQKRPQPTTPTRDAPPLNRKARAVRLVATPRVTNMDGNERPTGALPDRRHRPMLALSPRASASPKRHRIELGHHGRASRSRAVDLRARSPCCSTCACYATTHVGLWKRLCTHGPSAQRQSSWPHSWLCGECGQRVSSSASGPCVHRTSRSPWPHAPR